MHGLFIFHLGAYFSLKIKYKKKEIVHPKILTVKTSYQQRVLEKSI